MGRNWLTNVKTQTQTQTQTQTYLFDHIITNILHNYQFCSEYKRVIGQGDPH